MVLFFFEKNKTQTSPTCRNFGENKTEKHRIKYLNRFHAGPPAWIERKFTFMSRLF
jgi:hypothetical protein